MENQEYHVRDLLILEDDRRKQVKIGKDTFVILAAFPKDQKNISRRLALEYDGLPVNSFSLDDRYFFTRDVTLDVLIHKSPEWWSTASDCLDEEVKEMLYTEIVTWSNEFQEKLKKNQFTKRGKEKTE